MQENVRPQPRLTRPCAAWRRESRRLPVNTGDHNATCTPPNGRRKLAEAKSSSAFCYKTSVRRAASRPISSRPNCAARRATPAPFADADAQAPMSEVLTSQICAGLGLSARWRPPGFGDWRLPGQPGAGAFSREADAALRLRLLTSSRAKSVRRRLAHGFAEGKCDGTKGWSDL